MWHTEEATRNKAIMYCSLCGHSLENNQHGLDQNDSELSDKGELRHSGSCTYCKECNPSMITGPSCSGGKVITQEDRDRMVKNLRGRVINVTELDGLSWSLMTEYPSTAVVEVLVVSKDMINTLKNIAKEESIDIRFIDDGDIAVVHSL